MEDIGVIASVVAAACSCVTVLCCTLAYIRIRGAMNGFRKLCDEVAEEVYEDGTGNE